MYIVFYLSFISLTPCKVSILSINIILSTPDRHTSTPTNCSNRHTHSSCIYWETRDVPGNSFMFHFICQVYQWKMQQNIFNLICILCTCISDLNMKAKFKNKPGFKLKYFKVPISYLIHWNLPADSVCLDDLGTELLTLLFQLSFASSIPLLMLLFAILMALYPTLAQITATTVWRHQGRPLLIYPHPHQLNVWWMLSVKCVLSRAKAIRVVFCFLFFFFFACKLYECVWFVQKFDEFIMFIFSMLLFRYWVFCYCI